MAATTNGRRHSHQLKEEQEHGHLKETHVHSPMTKEQLEKFRRDPLILTFIMIPFSIIALVCGLIYMIRSNQALFDCTARLAIWLVVCGAVHIFLSIMEAPFYLHPNKYSFSIRIFAEILGSVFRVAVGIWGLVLLSSPNAIGECSRTTGTTAVSILFQVFLWIRVVLTLLNMMNLVQQWDLFMSDYSFKDLVFGASERIRSKENIGAEIAATRKELEERERKLRQTTSLSQHHSERQPTPIEQQPTPPLPTTNVDKDLVEEEEEEEGELSQEATEFEEQFDEVQLTPNQTPQQKKPSKKSIAPSLTPRDRK